MVTSTVLSHSPTPASALRRHPNSNSKPLALLISSSRRRFLEHQLPRISIPMPLTHSIEHLPRISILTPLTNSMGLLARTAAPCSLPTSHSLFSSPRSLPIPPWLDPSRLTPIQVCKWVAVAAVSLFAAKKLLYLLLNPFFWTYLSIASIFWPWYLALSVGAVGLYSLYRHLTGRSNLIHQLSILTSSIMWMTLVPLAHFNGFLEGWPVAFFFIYHYFFFFETSVRRRLYGDLNMRPHDSKWDVTVPHGAGSLFAGLVFLGHWLVALEAPGLHTIHSWWMVLPMWVLIIAVLSLRYSSVEYLAKYSVNVVVPTTVVQFGPYRLLRHPIYASNILMLASYCLAMRTALSLVFLTVASMIYYGWKAELEERLMVETFGERYNEYARKVPYRLIPFLY